METAREGEDAARSGRRVQPMGNPEIQRLQEQIGTLWQKVDEIIQALNQPQ